jgi:hypothetical protein
MQTAATVWVAASLPTSVAPRLNDVSSAVASVTAQLSARPSTQQAPSASARAWQRHHQPQSGVQLADRRTQIQGRGMIARAGTLAKERQRQLVVIRRQRLRQLTLHAKAPTPPIGADIVGDAQQPCPQRAHLPQRPPRAHPMQDRFLRGVLGVRWPNQRRRHMQHGPQMGLGEVDENVR